MTAQDVARGELRSEVALAASGIAPQYSLEAFIAVNPLGGLEALPFAEAVAETAATGARGTLTEEEYRRQHERGRISDASLRTVLAGRYPGADVDVLVADLVHGAPAPAPARTIATIAEQQDPALADRVDSISTRWITAFTGAEGAAWPMPGAERGFYAAWRELAPLDPTVSAHVRHELASLPERADDAALAALDRLHVAPAEWRHYFRAHLSRLPGWAGHIRWRATERADIDLVAWLALRLTYEAALLGDWDPKVTASAPVADQLASRVNRVRAALGLGEGETSRVEETLARMSISDRALRWQDAYELEYRQQLLDSIVGEGHGHPADRPSAQLVACIDTRSEGLRRQLEANPSIETLGFAGFFAVAIQYQDLAGGRPTALCPVLLSPRNRITESAAPGGEHVARRRVRRLSDSAAASDAFHAAKEAAVAPYALAEGAGWLAGPLAAARTVAPGLAGAVAGWVGRRAVPAAPTVLSEQEGFALDERIGFGEVALRMMGLTENFGRLVVLCGHGSETRNNPFQTALDCGACGGHGGAPNARTAAAILNGDDVRRALQERGIRIPKDTWFVAAEHNTATDSVTLLDTELVPSYHLAELAWLSTALREAGASLSAERLAVLPGAPRDVAPARAAKHTRARAADWSQVYPEWALAGNAALIVGPREMTRGVDLGRRTFLHSYRADSDPDGSGLETILTAPLVVAQWINAQYYFSSVDPEHFGAGTKTVHNVVGSHGVVSGASGDLRVGLPWQSVGVGTELVHEPLRLFVVVEAPLERIEQILDRNPGVRALFTNEWIAMVARPTPGSPWQSLSPAGWTPWRKRAE